MAVRIGGPDRQVFQSGWLAHEPARAQSNTDAETFVSIQGLTPSLRITAVTVLAAIVFPVVAIVTDNHLAKVAGAVFLSVATIMVLLRARGEIRETG